VRKSNHFVFIGVFVEVVIVCLGNDFLQPSLFSEKKSVLIRYRPLLSVFPQCSTKLKFPKKYSFQP